MSQADSDKHPPLNIRDQLIRDEGVRHEMYLDAAGFLTIGVGHNLRARPLSDRAVLTILDDDIAATISELEQTVPWIVTLSSARQGALLNYAYNVGVNKIVTEAPKFLAALQTHNWSEAANELLTGPYKQQAGVRAARLAQQIREDVWV